MNVELLRKVQAEILKEPRRFRMDKWVNLDAVGVGDSDPPCGTAACIGGYAVILAQGEVDHVEDWKKRAEDLWGHGGSFAGVTARQQLELTSQEAERLFYINGWPDEYANQYVGTINPAKRARIACDRIDHFIKTEGRE